MQAALGAASALASGKLAAQGHRGVEIRDPWKGQAKMGNTAINEFVLKQGVRGASSTEGRKSRHPKS